MKHPKLIRFINKYILHAHKRRYINIYSEKTASWYQAECKRSQFWYDTERITIRNILLNRKSWNVTYWDAYDGKGGRCEMWCRYEPLPYVYGSFKKAKPIITLELMKTMEFWISLNQQLKEQDND